MLCEKAAAATSIELPKEEVLSDMFLKEHKKQSTETRLKLLKE